mmetsp:Transcript_12982/g.41487  ORF Transcript_12982/g.41487 Transcript_12982/m.41487 type:complete len:203 (-) Transcript_12982:705-1313(-)
MSCKDSVMPMRHWMVREKPTSAAKPTPPSTVTSSPVGSTPPPGPVTGRATKAAGRPTHACTPASCAVKAPKPTRSAPVKSNANEAFTNVRDTSRSRLTEWSGLKWSRMPAPTVMPYLMARSRCALMPTGKSLMPLMRGLSMRNALVRLPRTGSHFQCRASVSVPTRADAHTSWPNTSLRAAHTMASGAGTPSLVAAHASSAA